MRRLQLEGKVFGRLTVLSPAPRTYQTMWNCVCVCGTPRVVSGPGLTNGTATSCGCYRNEVRGMTARKRNYNGANNPRAKKSITLNNGVHFPSSSVWYKRAAGVYYAARKKKVPMGFGSVAEFATYIHPLIPKRCPVFNRPFVERGAGFSKWSPSIDKIDPKRGYVPGNIQVISLFANMLKRDASRDELVTFAKWVLKETK